MRRELGCGGAVCLLPRKLMGMEHSAVLMVGCSLQCQARAVHRWGDLQQHYNRIPRGSWDCARTFWLMCCCDTHSCTAEPSGEVAGGERKMVGNNMLELTDCRGVAPSNMQTVMSAVPQGSNPVEGISSSHGTFAESLLNRLAKKVVVEKGKCEMPGKSLVPFFSKSRVFKNR